MLDFGFYNCDCMDGMREFPDKYFDLAIVDPPYGISITDSGRLKRYNSDNGEWDAVPPTEEYFKELFRVSKNQIILGGQLLSAPAVKVLFDMGQEAAGGRFVRVMRVCVDFI